jgi:hypothetical protein
LRNECGINQLQDDLIGTNCGDGMTLNQTRYLELNSTPGNLGALHGISLNGLPRTRQFSIRFIF